MVEQAPRHLATGEEVRKLEAKANWGRSPDPGWERALTVADSVAVGFDEVRLALGLRAELPIHVRVRLGHLKPCFSQYGEQCVTRASLDREVQWWAEAPLWRRVLRRFAWLRLAEE